VQTENLSLQGQFFLVAKNCIVDVILDPTKTLLDNAKDVVITYALLHHLVDSTPIDVYLHIVLLTHLLSQIVDAKHVLQDNNLMHCRGNAWVLQC
jgi:hypothetical protein